jgi:hypothetical protein
MKKIAVLYLSIIICGSAFAQKYNGNEAADYVRRERDKAWIYYDKKDHTPAKIRILDNAIALLDTSYVQEKSM